MTKIVINTILCKFFLHLPIIHVYTKISKSSFMESLFMENLCTPIPYPLP